MKRILIQFFILLGFMGFVMQASGQSEITKPSIVPPTPKTRVCSVCGQNKSLQSFTGKSKICRTCVQKANKEKERKQEDERRKAREREERKQKQAEQDRIAKEQAEQERLAHEQAEKDRLSREKAELERNRIIQNLINNMVYVEGGTFTMGATKEQKKYAEDNEKPAHQESVNSFYIGKYEVTQEEWEAVIGNNPSKYKGIKRPVEQVSWDDCQTFIYKLNQLTGKRFRLPTEEEWEYAARGGNLSKGYKYSGSNIIGNVAWYHDNSGNTTQEVGQKQPNELGLYDMSGNVSELCYNFDCFYQLRHRYRRIIRGGSWFENIRYGDGCRVSSRSYNGYKAWDRGGLRLALSLPQTEISQQSMRDSILLNLINNMVYVQGGTFTMGDTSERNSQPHQVTLSSFYIGRYEVTLEEWETVMGFDPSRFKGFHIPVVQVTWNECQQFIQKLNQFTGKKFRLPTEAEWEFAARGGNHSRGYKYPGSDNLKEVAWYSGNSKEQLHSVGQKNSNELGLYDMSGNALEWCHDWYSGNYYSKSSTTNPRGPSSGSERVCRGGYYAAGDKYIDPFPVYSRCSKFPTPDEGVRGRLDFDYIGLRLACDSNN